MLNERIVFKLFIEEFDKNIEFYIYFVLEYNKEMVLMIVFKEIGNKVKISSNYYKSSFKE